MAVSDREMGAPAEVKWQKNERECERERRGQREREREREEMRNEEKEEWAHVLMIHVNFIDEFVIGKK